MVPSGHEIIFAKGSKSNNLSNLPAIAARELGQCFLHLFHLGQLVSCPNLLLLLRGSLALHRAEQLVLCSRNQQLLSPQTNTPMSCCGGRLNSGVRGRVRRGLKNPTPTQRGVPQHPWEGARALRRGASAKTSIFSFLNTSALSCG